MRDRSIAAFLALCLVVSLCAVDPADAAGDGSITGTITREGSGLPLAGIRVALNNLTTGGWAQKTNSAADGAYQFSNLDDGSYRLLIVDHGGIYQSEWHRNAADATSAEIVVVSGGQVVVDAELVHIAPSGSITGTITSQSTGAPLHGIRVALNSLATGTWFGKTNTAGNGTYGFSGLPDGEYRLSYIDHGGNFIGEWFSDAPNAAAATVVSVFGSPVVVNASLSSNSLTSSLVDRDLHPVVMPGSTLADLVGEDPDEIVGFRWEGGAWVQSPVQVDERHVADLKKLRDGSGAIGTTVLAYSDAASNAGSDPTATFDTNDEVVFMGGDTGDEPPPGAPNPANVQAGSRFDVTITDPADPGAQAWLSLFIRSGTALDPAAGVDYVDYNFAPIDSTFENSTVTTDRYSTHFSATWVRDQVRLPAPYGTNADILDRHRNLFVPGNCVRSEDTFSSGGGGFATNVDGPIRAIRSRLGANSGTYTQRQHLFYRGHEETSTYLRVHSIPGILDLWDYSSAASGMTYTNDLNPGGVTINGVPDAGLTAGVPTWERIEGTQGGLVQVHSLETDIAPQSITATSYYLDDSTPPLTQCTGDAFEYGQSGLWITSSLPNTDPVNPPAKTLTARRDTWYAGSGIDDEATDTLVTQANAPLVGS